MFAKPRFQFDYGAVACPSELRRRRFGLGFQHNADVFGRFVAHVGGIGTFKLNNLSQLFNQPDFAPDRGFR
jgi:hypothetical protein